MNYFLQVLQQVTPKANDVMTREALRHSESNRSLLYLPGEFVFIAVENVQQL